MVVQALKCRRRIVLAKLKSVFRKRAIIGADLMRSARPPNSDEESGTRFKLGGINVDTNFDHALVG